MLKSIFAAPLAPRRHAVLLGLSLLIGLGGALLQRAAGGDRIEAIVTLHVVEGLRWAGLDAGYSSADLPRAELLFLVLSTLALAVLPYLMLRWAHASHTQGTR